MTISRDTFLSSRDWERIRVHQNRPILDSEINEVQDVIIYQRKTLLNEMFGGPALGGGSSAIANNPNGTNTGMELTFDHTAHTVTIQPGYFYSDGVIKAIPITTLTAGDSSTPLTIYMEIIKYNINATSTTSDTRVISSDDAAALVATPGLLSHPDGGGRVVAEREKWVWTLKLTDTSGDALPSLATSRIVYPIYTFHWPTYDGDGRMLTQPVIACLVGRIISSADQTGWNSHIGSSGLPAHAVATRTVPGFLSASGKISVDSIASRTAYSVFHKFGNQNFPGSGTGIGSFFSGSGPYTLDGSSYSLPVWGGYIESIGGQLNWNQRAFQNFCSVFLTVITTPPVTGGVSSFPILIPILGVDTNVSVWYAPYPTPGISGWTDLLSVTTSWTQMVNPLNASGVVQPGPSISGPAFRGIHFNPSFTPGTSTIVAFMLNATSTNMASLTLGSWIGSNVVVGTGPVAIPTCSPSVDWLSDIGMAPYFYSGTLLGGYGGHI